MPQFRLFFTWKNSKPIVFLHIMPYHEHWGAENRNRNKIFFNKHSKQFSHISACTFMRGDTVHVLWRTCIHILYGEWLYAQWQRIISIIPLWYLQIPAAYLCLAGVVYYKTNLAYNLKYCEELQCWITKFLNTFQFAKYNTSYEFLKLSNFLNSFNDLCKRNCDLSHHNLCLSMECSIGSVNLQSWFNPYFIAEYDE